MKEVPVIWTYRELDGKLLATTIAGDIIYLATMYQQEQQQAANTPKRRVRGKNKPKVEASHPEASNGQAAAST